jgi:hypothetical protein
MITESDLKAPRTSPTDAMFFAELRSSLVKSPLMIVGWSISEPYLIAVINETIKTVVQRGRVEEFPIEPRPFPLCFSYSCIDKI